MPPRKSTTTPKTTTAKATPAKVAEVKAEEVKAENISVDSLLPSPDASPAPQAPESFESIELAALRAELAKANEELAKARTNPTDGAGRPVPESELTPEQREIRNLQDQLARTKGSSLAELQEEEEEVGEDGILVHILADGFSALGRVFYRGEELLIGPQAYEDTKDRTGRSWVQMTDEEQYARWGNVRFRKGPWPGQRAYEEEALASKSIRTVAPLTRI